jgi:hypothetical protein
MLRELVGIKTPDFQGWACSQCAWVFNPSDALNGKTLEEMKENYKLERDQTFAAHSCAENPRPKPAEAK